MKKRVVVLGATGSIGQNALDIIRAFPQHFKLVGFSYHSNTKLSSCIAEEFCEAVPLCTQEFCQTTAETCPNEKHTSSFKAELDIFIQFLTRCEPDVVINGIQGAAGLLPSYATLWLKTDLCLANKESIVMAYDILKKLADVNGASIIPVDSEHWAIFQLLNMAKKQKIDKLIITASGGAFRDVPSNELKNVSVERCFAHPTWKMGAKITIDSATLANKALEVIEATKLFGVSTKDIVVTIHKESIVHSMVQTLGGSIYAQLSPPDMRGPIFGALMFPEDTPQYLAPLDFSTTFSLSFAPPRNADFPMLKMGFCVAERGATSYPVAFNAANEVAVSAFMSGKIAFLDIPQVVDEVLQADWGRVLCELEEVYEADEQARTLLQKRLEALTTSKRMGF